MIQQKDFSFIAAENFVSYENYMILKMFQWIITKGRWEWEG
jgi:hypothetical protein